MQIVCVSWDSHHFRPLTSTEKNCQTYQWLKPAHLVFEIAVPNYPEKGGAGHAYSDDGPNIEGATSTIPSIRSIIFTRKLTSSQNLNTGEPTTKCTYLGRRSWLIET